ncbi:MAG: DNA helicase RecG, partial [Candidatus Omnitrophota bacterium]|nr:DNA helicase RecG [Candidatus Omnitrophota bacterium]
MTVSQGRLHERPIRYIKGVGPYRAGQLASLGIATVEDACYYPPRRYEDRTRLAAIRDLAPGQMATVRVRVLSTALRRLRRGRTLFEMTVGDSSGTLKALWFHSPFLAQQVSAGQECLLYGRLEPGARAQMIHPEMEAVEDDDSSLHMGRIVPIYPVTTGVSQRWVRRLIATILEESVDELEETLPEPLRLARGWPVVAAAVRELHFPSSWTTLESAKQRLAFDELLLLQLALAQRRAQTMATVKPHRYMLDGPLTQGLRQRLPFQLTASQERVFAELLEDLRQP